MPRAKWRAGPAALATLCCCLFSFSRAQPLVQSCPAGLEPRAATADDLVCASPASRKRAAGDNARAPLLWVPGFVGPKTCASGYVWREATPDDMVCVLSAVRAETRQENANNPHLASVP